VSDLRVSEAITLPATDLSWRAVRASGPGGQNVNKVASKVELRFDLAGSRALDEETKARLRRLAGTRHAGGAIIIVSQAARDQPRNLEDARQKLAALVRRALLRPKRRKPTRPTRGSVERRIAAKAHRGRIKAQRRGDDQRG
jgi:ribosome-associated protein